MLAEDDVLDTVLVVCELDVDDVADVDDNADHAAHDNAHENDAQFADVEVVDSNVHEREGFKEGVIDTCIFR